jgi:glycosidase
VSQKDKTEMTDGWFDLQMPDLNNKNPRVAKYLIQNAIWWIEYSNIDSYRIDTWIYPDQIFMRDWCEAINKEYPKFFKFGEAWVQGNSNQAYFTQNSKLKDVWNSGLEAVTDFQMYFAIQEATSKPSAWNEGTARIYNTLANDFLYENAYRNVTFLDNHDCSRIFSVVGEDQTKLKSALALLMTTRGIPQLYYGTEILMKNFSDPDGKVREDFPGGWKGDPKNKFTSRGRSVDENQMYTYVKRLADYHRAERAMQDGKTMQFIPKDGTYVYFRYNESKTIMVVYNPSDKEIVLNTDRFKEMTGKYTSAKNICNDKIVPSIAAFKVPKFETMVLELR